MRLIRNLILFLLFAGLSSSQAQSIPSWKITEVEQMMDRSDSVLVISFWATFCKPCIEEIPYLQSISNKYKDERVKLLLVSLDLAAFYPDRIKAFAKKHNITSPIVWLNETNADHFCPKIDESWSGAIPATLIVNNKTGYKKFVEEQMKPEEFELELKKAIGKNN
jgi:thiol-disulfide isomerase/thioredoxin